MGKPPLVGGVASPLSGRRGLAVGEREGGMLGVCEPLGVGVEEDGCAECLRAPRAGMGGASGKRVGVRMRVLREGLNECGWLDVSREGVVVGVMGADEFERPDGPWDVDGIGGVGSGAGGSGGRELVSSSASGCCSLLSLFGSGSQGSYTSLGPGAGANLSDGCRVPLSVGPGSAAVRVSC